MGAIIFSHRTFCVFTKAKEVTVITWKHSVRGWGWELNF